MGDTCIEPTSQVAHTYIVFVVAAASKNTAQFYNEIMVNAQLSQ